MIIFSNDYSVRVKESRDEIEKAIKKAAKSFDGPPLVHLTRERDNQDLLVNAAQIWIILG